MESTWYAPGIQTLELEIPRHQVKHSLKQSVCYNYALSGGSCQDFHLNVYANKSHCANGIIGMIDTPSLIIYYCDSRRPLLITNSLISQISQNPLYPWCDSGLHSECLVGRMSVSGLFGCLSSEVDSFTPFPQFGGAEVDENHAEYDSPLPS